MKAEFLLSFIPHITNNSAFIISTFNISLDFRIVVLLIGFHLPCLLTLVSSYQGHDSERRHGRWNPITSDGAVWTVMNPIRYAVWFRMGTYGC